MKKPNGFVIEAIAAAAAGLLLGATTVLAHHSLASFDTEAAVTISGTIVRFEQVNPHSFLYVDQETSDGIVRWAVEAPAPNLFTRRAIGQEQLVPGLTVEACGYVLRNETPRPEGRVLVAEVVETADGEAWLWSDYGKRHCREQGRYVISNR